MRRIKSIIQWIIFLCIIYYIRLYVVPLLILTYLLYLYKFPKAFFKPYGFNSKYIGESLLYFVIGMIFTPITFIVGVFGISTPDYPDGP